MDFITFIGLVSGVLGIVSFIFLEGSKKVKALFFFMLLAGSFFAGGYYLNLESQKNDKLFYSTDIYELTELSRYWDYNSASSELIYDHEVKGNIYGLDRYEKDDCYFIVFEQYLEGKNAKYLILDTISIPKLGQDEVLETGCNENVDYKVFAICKNRNENEEYYDKIQRAWKLNLKTKRIEEIFDYDFLCYTENY